MLCLVKATVSCCRAVAHSRNEKKRWAFLHGVPSPSLLPLLWSLALRWRGRCDVSGALCPEPGSWRMHAGRNKEAGTKTDGGKGDRGRQKETMLSFLLPEIVPHLTFDSGQYLTLSFIVFLSPAQSKQKLDPQVWDVFALFPIFLLGKLRLLTPRAPKTV